MGVPTATVSERSGAAYVGTGVLGTGFCRQGCSQSADDRRLDRAASIGQDIAAAVWLGADEPPSEATFSRAFAEFAKSRLPNRVHEALIEHTHKAQLVGHISRDSTAIEAREKPMKIEGQVGAGTNAAAQDAPAKPKRGRPRKPPVPRILRQNHIESVRNGGRYGR